MVFIRLSEQNLKCASKSLTMLHPNAHVAVNTCRCEQMAKFEKKSKFFEITSRKCYFLKTLLALRDSLIKHRSFRN